MAVFLLDAAAFDERKDVDVVCPVDGTKFKAVEIVSTNIFGGVDADGCQHAYRTAPIEFRVWTCPTCRYSGQRTKTRDDFAASNAALKDKVLGKLKTTVTITAKSKQEDIPGWAKHDLMAQVLELKGAPAQEIATAYIGASWCAREAGSPGLADFEEWDAVLERYGLKKSPLDLGRRNRTDLELEALPRLEKDLAAAKGADRLLLVFTLAHLARRHGENVQALAWITELRTAKGENSVIDAAAAKMEESIERERSFQSKAAGAYAKAADDVKEPALKAEAQYLVGELRRRLGEGKEAAAWFDKAVATDASLKDLVAKQKARIPR